MLERWITMLIRGRWILALLWIALMVGSAGVLPRLQFKFNLGQMLRGDETRLADVREFYTAFPAADGHIMLSATADRVLTINDLRATERWADQIRQLPEVKEVISPRLLLDLKMDGFTLEEWARLGGDGNEPLSLGDGLGMETFKGQIVSRDLKSVALYVIKKKKAERRALYRAIENNLTPPWPGAEVRMVGTEYLLEQMGGLLGANFRTLLLLEVAALLLVVPFFMRSLRRAYLPMLAAGSALLLYLALFILAGQQFSAMHLAGPGLILIIGLADAIHLQQKFDDARADGLGLLDSLRAMFQSVGQACVLTSLTTACGFASLLVARHEEVYEFGLWCSIGVVTAFAVVMGFMPIALIFFPSKSSPPAAHRFWLDPRQLRRWAAPATLLLLLLSAGVFRARMDSSLDRELPDSVKTVRDGHWFAENFRGLDRIELDLHADLRNPDVFALVERMQHDLRQFPGIAGSRSYVDAVRMTLAPEVIETKDGPRLGVQALSSSGAFPEHLLSRQLNRACIVFYRTRGFGTEAFESFRARVADYATQLPRGGSLRLNGAFPMFYDSTTLISKTMMVSLACSLGMITLILVIVLRSARLALLCLVPNAVPLLVVAGISGWLGQPLHLGVLIVFSVGLGLAVDDTIHLMVRFKQLQQEKPSTSLRTLLDEAIVSTGFAIVLTSVVLFISALCFLGSSFTTMRWTGVTLSVVAVTALLADLMILPWLIEKFYGDHRAHPLPSAP
jgi:predicted RND superfamily exporter protein